MKTRASAITIIAIITALAAAPLVEGFAPFLATSHRGGIESSHYAVVKKKAATKKDTQKIEQQEVFRKPEFVASIAEKTGMTKVESEQALAAVLDVIQEVRRSMYIYIRI